MSLKLLLKRQKRISLIWFVPFIALLVSGSLIYQAAFNKGPVITLKLAKADGLVAGKTSVKALSVEVGVIQTISLADDLSSVIATVQMLPNTEHLLNKDSIFWVHKPRVNMRGVSGLDTILSGNYIELRPGRSEEKEHTFSVLDDQPLLFAKDALAVELYAGDNKRVSVGDFITFKGMEAGVVSSKEYDREKDAIKYTATIYPQFAQFVTNKTVFWINNGFSITMGATGIKVDTESLNNILQSGISFDDECTNDIHEQCTCVANGQKYRLYGSRKESIEHYEKTIDYMILANNIEFSLAPGTPVFYNGVQIGEIKKAPYFKNDFHLFKDQIDYYAILISIQMERFDQHNGRSVEELKADIRNTIQKTPLMASVESVNFFAGINFLNLKPATIEDTTQQNLPETFDNYDVIAYLHSDFKNMKASFANFADQVGKLKLDELIQNTNKFISSSEHTARDISALAKSVQELADNLNKNDLSEETANTLKHIQKLLQNYDKNSPMYTELTIAVRNLNATLKSLKPLAKKIEEKPNSLIFSDERKDPTPTKAKR